MQSSTAIPKWWQKDNRVCGLQKGTTHVSICSLTHQGTLVVGHSPQGHHTALPGTNSNTDLVRLQGVVRRAGDTNSSHWWVRRGQRWVQVSIRCHRNCTELGICVEGCRKKKVEKRRKCVPRYPVTISLSKLFTTLAAANRILALTSMNINSFWFRVLWQKQPGKTLKYSSQSPKLMAVILGARQTSRALIRQTQADR